MDLEVKPGPAGPEAELSEIERAARQHKPGRGDLDDLLECADEPCVDEASKESFPASDPPGWTMGTTGAEASQE